MSNEAAAIERVSAGCRCGRELRIRDRATDQWRRRRAYFCARCDQAPRNCYCDPVVAAEEKPRVEYTAADVEGLALRQSGDQNV